MAVQSKRQSLSNRKAGSGDLLADEVRAKLAIQGAEPLGSTPEEYRTYIGKELQRWAGVVKSTGIKLD